MGKILLRIGERLKEIRNSRQLTLDDVAKITGVSKPMLGQIERGQSSPTINTLWKIATGLKIPLSFFCKQEEADFQVVGLEDIEQITEENGWMKAYLVFPFDPLRNVEVFFLELEAQVSHPSEPQRRGVEKYIFVTEGTLMVIIGGEEVVLTSEQSLRFRADVAHVYYNSSEDQCTFYDMIFYPNE